MKITYKSTFEVFLCIFFFVIPYSNIYGEGAQCRPDYLKAVRAYVFRDFSEAQKLLKKVERNIKRSDGPFNLILQSQLAFLKSCINYENPSMTKKKRIEKALPHINNALLKNSRSIILKIRYVEIISAKFQNRTRILDQFDYYNKDYPSPHTRMRDLYKSIFYHTKGEHKQALKYAEKALKDKNTSDTQMFYIQSFVLYYDNDSKEGFKYSYELFLKCLSELSDDDSDEILYFKGKALRFQGRGDKAQAKFNQISDCFFFYPDLQMEKTGLFSKIKQKIPPLLKGIKASPFNAILWELLFKAMDRAYDWAELDRYKQEIKSMLRVMDHKIRNSPFPYSEICKGIIAIYEDDYEKAKLYFKNYKDFKMNGQFILDEYLLRLYINTKNIEEGSRVIKRNSIELGKVSDLILSGYEKEFYKNAALIACRAGRSIYLDYLEVIKKQWSDSYYEVKKQIDLIINARLNQVYERTEYNTRILHKLEEKLALKYEYLLNKIIDNRIEIIQKLDHLKVQLGNQIKVLEGKTDSIENRILRDKAILLHQILENRKNIGALRNELRTGLGDYVKATIGFQFGPFRIAINLNQIIEDILDLF
jgi:hypothetical protein